MAHSRGRPEQKAHVVPQVISRALARSSAIVFTPSFAASSRISLVTVNLLNCSRLAISKWLSSRASSFKISS
jgi:hypothetical protein